MIYHSQAWLSGLVKHGLNAIADPVDMTTIGERIQEAMDAADLDQPALARRIGVSKQAVSAMISGSTKAPTAENVFRIAEATGYEARWIVTGKGPRTKKEAAMERLDISMLSPVTRRPSGRLYVRLRNKKTIPTAPTEPTAATAE